MKGGKEDELRIEGGKVMVTWTQLGVMISLVGLVWLIAKNK